MSTFRPSSLCERSDEVAVLLHTGDSDTEDRANEETPREDRVQLEHVSNTKCAYGVQLEAYLGLKGRNSPYWTALV